MLALRSLLSTGNEVCRPVILAPGQPHFSKKKQKTTHYTFKIGGGGFTRTNSRPALALMSA